MNIFKRQRPPENYERAMEDVENCLMTIRAGTEKSSHRSNHQGVRVLVNYFGSYPAFILGKQTTKDWLKRAYDLSEGEARSVWRALERKAQKMLRNEGQKVASYADEIKKSLLQ